MGIRRSWIVAVTVMAALIVTAGCQDLREFAGTWHGPVVADPALAHGFAPGASVSADVSSVGRDGVDVTFTLPSGRTARFVPIRRAAGDVLADVQLPGEPLRTFFGFVQDGDGPAPGAATQYLAVVSLYSDSRLELRLIRGADDAYGVFALRRVPDRPAAVDAGGSPP